jgi:O-acetylhomoserine/O-acetylserine sulfhydrylase-like pyridoxal-dependent enzyme
MKIPTYEKAIQLPHIDTRTKSLFIFTVTNPKLSADEIDSIVELCRRNCVVHLNKAIDEASMKAIENKLLAMPDGKAQGNERWFWCSN